MFSGHFTEPRVNCPAHSCENKYREADSVPQEEILEDLWSKVVIIVRFSIKTNMWFLSHLLFMSQLNLIFELSESISPEVFGK